MKKIIMLTVVMLFVASVAFGAVLGSRHDLTAAAYYTGGTATSACQYCHTPHLRSNDVVAGAPLWNKSLPAAGSYTLYGDASKKTVAGTQIVNPGANSRTCLSCHDGTIGLGDILIGTDATIAAVAATGGATITGGKLSGANTATGRLTLIGTDLSQEHPVGFVVNTSVAGLDTIAAMKGHGARFYNSDTEMQCGTCHDPHETAPAKSPFLRMTKATMCTDCHITK